VQKYNKEIDSLNYSINLIIVYAIKDPYIFVSLSVFFNKIVASLENKSDYINSV